MFISNTVSSEKTCNLGVKNIIYSGLFKVCAISHVLLHNGLINILLNSVTMHYFYAKLCMLDKSLLLWLLVFLLDCPNEPRDVQVFDVNSRNLTINWTEPHSNNDPIIGYNINFQNPDCLVNANVSTQNVTIISMEEQVIITNLHPGEAYTFTIIAINNICHSQSSLPASVHTIEEGVFM